MSKGNFIFLFACCALFVVAIISFFAPKYFFPDTSLAGLTETFQARIAEAPTVKGARTNLILEPIEGGSLSGNSRIWISIPTEEPYVYGEHLLVSGVLERPENFSNFNWVGYLAKEGVAYVIYKPNIQKSEIQENGIRSILFRWRVKGIESINYVLSPPHSALYTAMLFDDRGEFSQDNSNDLRGSGLSHIVAISGTHIAIIALLLFFCTLALGFWRHHARFIAFGIVILYTILVGAPASAVRATVMIAALLVAEHFGRPASALRALMYAAAGMVIFNPLLLRYDIGFQLSFAAVLGIILFYDKLEKFLKRIPENIAHLRSAASTTIAAQIFTTPIIMWHFHTISPFVLVSNLLVVPFSPFFLIAGFIILVGGLFGGVIASALATPAWLLSSYFWFMAGIFS